MIDALWADSAIALFESAAFVVVLVNNEQQIVRVNPHTERLLGYPPGDLNGKSAHLLIIPEGSSDHLNFSSDPTLRSEAAPKRVRMRSAESNDIQFLIGVIPVTPPGGQPDLSLIIGRPTMPHDNAEEALRLSQEKYREILANLQGMSYRAKNDHNWTLEHVSEGSKEILGIDPEDFMSGKYTLGELVHPDDIDEVRSNLDVGLKHRRQIQHEFRIITPDGDLRWVLEKCHGIYNTAGEITAIEGLLIDITESKQLRDRLRETEDTLQSFIDNVPVAIAMFDRNMNYLATSKRWLTNFNLKHEVVGRNHYEVFPNLPEHWLQAHQKGLSGKIIQQPEDLFIRPNGSEQWVRWEIHPWFDASGQVGGIMIFSEDISQQKAASIERDRINHALDAALDGIFMLDPETLRFFYVNRGATEQTGYSKEELLQMTPDDLAPEFNLEELKALFKELVEGDSNKRVVETVHQTKCNRLIPVEVSLQYMPEASGKHSILAVARDRTEQINITQQLKHRDAILSAVSFVANNLLNTADWEAEMPEILARLGQASNASRAYFFDRHDDDGAPKVTQRYEWCAPNIQSEINNPFYQNMSLAESGFGRWGDLFDQGVSVYGSINDFPKSERTHLEIQGICSIAVFPIIVNDTWQGIIGFDQCDPNRKWSKQEMDAMQVSASTLGAAMERSAAQLALLRLNEELEQRVIERTRSLEYANRELEAFSYSVSHDLRAPLRAVVGFSNILIEDFGESLGEDGQRILRVIENNSLKMGSLIDDLISFARIGKKDLQTHETDMNALVNSVINDLNLREHNTLEIEINDLPPSQCDAKLIAQVLHNLLSNAMKYSALNPKPKITIEAHLENGTVIYSVHDNGVGFDMKYYDKLFGVFQRLHSNPEFEGTGIGLALVKRIIDKHGGRIWAEGKINEGATFRFSLPAA